MREVPLKEVSFNLQEIGGEDIVVPFSYKESMMAMLNAPQEKGFSIEDIENRLLLREKLKNAKGTLRLEESEYAFLQTLVEKERWRVAHKVVIDFMHDFKNAKRVE